MARSWHAGYIPEVVKSLDEPIHPQEPDGISFVDMVPSSDPNPEEALLEKDKRREIREALKKMRPNERVALLMHARGYTLQEIGSRRGVCRERARQWERDARLAARRIAVRERYASDAQFREKECARQVRLRKEKRNA